MRFFFLFIFSITFLYSQSITLDKMKTESRIAFVIGNEDYDDSPILNATKNSKSMKQFLEQRNFKVIYIENATKRETIKAVRKFDSNIGEGGIVLLYYCGHAVQYKDKNFLIPIDSSIDKDADIVTEGVESKAIISKMLASDNRLNIIIIDSSYKDPFGEYFKIKKEGLSKITTLDNMDVIFSAKPNTTVNDYGFTNKLIKILSKKGTSNKSGFIKVRKNTKFPYIKLSNNTFYFNLPDSLENKDAKMWKNTLKLSSISAFNLYLKQYPNGKYTLEAKTYIKDFKLLEDIKNKEKHDLELQKKAKETQEKIKAEQLAQKKEKEKLLAQKKAKEEALKAEQLKKQKAIKIKNTHFTEPELVFIKAGSVDVRDEDFNIINTITMKKSFYVSKYEITFAQYKDFLKATSKKTTLTKDWIQDKKPVVNISLKEARNYAAWLSEFSKKTYRLPTENEWEYIARANASTIYYWGERDLSHRKDAWRKDYPDNAHDYAWIKTNAKDITHIVGQKKPNNFGIYDVLGNAAEWCQSSDSNKGILRGGSFNSMPNNILLTSKEIKDATFKNKTTGFRLILEIKEN